MDQDGLQDPIKDLRHLHNPKQRKEIKSNSQFRMTNIHLTDMGVSEIGVPPVIHFRLGFSLRKTKHFGYPHQGVVPQCLEQLLRPAQGAPKTIDPGTSQEEKDGKGWKSGAPRVRRSTDINCTWLCW